MPRLNRNANPSASIRHTRAPTRSGGPSGGTTSSCTVVPVFNRALVLTFAPRVLISTELDKYRLGPTLTTMGQATRVRGWRRRSCCRRRGMTVTPCNSCPPEIGSLTAYRTTAFSHERPTSSTAMLPPRSQNEEGRGTLRLPDSFSRLSMAMTRLFVSVSTACMRLIPPTSSHPAKPKALGFPEMLTVPRRVLAALKKLTSAAHVVSSTPKNAPRRWTDPPSATSMNPPSVSLPIQFVPVHPPKEVKYRNRPSSVVYVSPAMTIGVALKNGSPSPSYATVVGLPKAPGPIEAASPSVVQASSANMPTTLGVIHFVVTRISSRLSHVGTGTGCAVPMPARDYLRAWTCPGARNV